MSKVYQIVTDKVIAALEAGTAPWRKPWNGGAFWPRNLTSGKQYRGINVFLLAMADYESPYWMTFKQAKSLGGSVKKGEKSTPIVFWSQVETKDKQTGDKIKIPCLRYYSGFNLAQCELPAKKMPPVVKVEEREFTPIECCEQIVAGYNGAPEVQLGFTKAAYRPSLDTVVMPNPERFHCNEEYYSTLFHELTHSTGHKSRLARKGIVDADASFGNDKYGREELVAEMGAAFLCGHAGIEAVTIDNSASYLAGWLKVIKGDPKLIVQAAGAAQKAADLILGTTWDDEATTDTPKPAKVTTTKRPTKPVIVPPVVEPEPLPVAEPVAPRGQLSLFA